MQLGDIGGWAGVLRRLTSRGELSRAEAAAAMSDILAGNATPAQIAGFIVALRMKGEATEELNGLLDAMFEAATLVSLPEGLVVIDVVGSGGDQSHSINVSTLAALTAVGAGARICKHGNRAASSTSGSADLLEGFGVALDVSPETVATCVVEAGIGFCFAPRFHPAMRHAGPARRELGVPTVFNYLGPIANPARVKRLLLGVGDATMARPMLDVLAARGAEAAWVVHGDDGMDELTTATTSQVLELRNAEVHAVQVDPATFGLAPATRADLAVQSQAEALAAARAVLDGAKGRHRDIVVLNAGAALLVAGIAVTLADGIERASESLSVGAAAVALTRLVEVSNS